MHNEMWYRFLHWGQHKSRILYFVVMKNWMVSWARREYVRTLLSLLRSLAVSHFYPGLAPWAAFLRRFAALNPSCSPATGLKIEFSHRGWETTDE